MLEFYQIIILIGVGIIVGLAMGTIGQTGQAIIVPIIFLMSGDIILAIAVSLLNDLLTASTVSVRYIKNGNYDIKKNIFIYICVSSLASILGVYIPSLVSNPSTPRNTLSTKRFCRFFSASGPTRDSECLRR